MDTYSKLESPTPSSSSSPPPPPTSTTDTINGSHEFKISGYSLSKGIGMGKYVSSDMFMVGGHSWAIYFYPDGKNPDDNAMYISVFIVLASDSTDVRALFELSLMDQSGKQQHKVHTQFGRVLDGGPYMLKTRGSMWGYKRFLERTALETSDYLKDDCLLVKCTVGVVRSDIKGPEIYNTPSPTSDINRDFGRLLEIGEGTDVNLEVDEEIYPGH